MICIFLKVVYNDMYYAHEAADTAEAEEEIFYKRVEPPGCRPL